MKKLNWKDLRRMYLKLEKLRFQMSRRDPVTNGTRGRPRQTVEEIAMNLEEAIDREVNRITADALIESLRKEQQRCGTGQASAASSVPSLAISTDGALLVRATTNTYRTPQNVAR